jgi:phosphoribosylformylglycinamidine cyclo-ligase
VIYAPAIGSLLDSVDVHAVAHITGGGMPGNLNRVLGSHCDAEVDPGSWEWPRIFTEMQQIGSVSDDEMRKVFNLGIGMVAVVPPDAANKAIDVLRTSGHRARSIGQVVAGSGIVRFSD